MTVDEYEKIAEVIETNSEVSRDKQRNFTRNMKGEKKAVLVGARHGKIKTITSQRLKN